MSFTKFIRTYLKYSIIVILAIFQMSFLLNPSKHTNRKIAQSDELAVSSDEKDDLNAFLDGESGEGAYDFIDAGENDDDLPKKEIPITREFNIALANYKQLESSCRVPKDIEEDMESLLETYDDADDGSQELSRAVSKLSSEFKHLGLLESNSSKRIKYSDINDSDEKWLDPDDVDDLKVISKCHIDRLNEMSEKDAAEYARKNITDPIVRHYIEAIANGASPEEIRRNFDALRNAADGTAVAIGLNANSGFQILPQVTLEASNVATKYIQQLTGAQSDYDKQTILNNMNAELTALKSKYLPLVSGSAHADSITAAINNSIDVWSSTAHQISSGQTINPSQSVGINPNGTTLPGMTALPGSGSSAFDLSVMQQQGIPYAAAHPNLAAIIPPFDPAVTGRATGSIMRGGPRGNLDPSQLDPRKGKQRPATDIGAMGSGYQTTIPTNTLPW